MSTRQTKSKGEIVAEIVNMSPEEFREFMRNRNGISKTEDEVTGFMSEIECRKFIGNISRSTLFHLRKTGLPSIKVGGRRLYRREDVEKFIISKFGLK